MDTLMKVLGYYLIIIGIATGANWALNDLWPDTAREIWVYLDILMCIALVICLIVNTDYARSSSHDGSAVQWLSSRVSIIGTLVLLLLFLRNYIGHEVGAEDLDAQMWTHIDTLAFLVFGATGLRISGLSLGSSGGGEDSTAAEA